MTDDRSRGIDRLVALSLEHRGIVVLLAGLLLLGGLYAVWTLPTELQSPPLLGTSSSLLQGAGLVILAVFFFMGHVRSALLVVVQLLLAALATFLALRATGQSLDLMTLTGLVLTLGLLVDGTIVLVESAVRRLGDRRARTLNGRKLILQASQEVVRPVAFGVVAVPLALLPLAGLWGLEGLHFTPLLWTVVLATVCALGLSVTVTPALASWLLRPAPIFAGGLLRHPADFVRRAYRPRLAWALRHPRLVVGATTAFLSAAAILLPYLDNELVPTGEASAVRQPALVALGAVVPISLLLLFVLLYAYFRTVRPVLLIQTAIAFGLAGGVLGLAMSGLPLSLAAAVGFLALFGIVLLNGLVMIELFRALEAEGRGRNEAVRIGAELRLRPVLMTCATTVAGVLPLLWIDGAGAEFQRPLAVVVISGVFVSTLLTLMVLPVLYQWLGGPAEATESAPGLEPASR